VPGTPVLRQAQDGGLEAFACYRCLETLVAPVSTLVLNCLAVPVGYLYIVRCADGTPYVGSTTNVEYRLSQHQAGLGGDYTSARLPVILVYTEEYATIYEAFLREREVKGWSRSKKEALIHGRYDLLPPLAKSRSRFILKPPVHLQAQRPNHHPEPVEGRTLS
jgi:putative endonuclease